MAEIDELACRGGVVEHLSIAVTLSNVKTLTILFSESLERDLSNYVFRSKILLWTEFVVFRK